jgi:hypothetical protein
MIPGGRIKQQEKKYSSISQVRTKNSQQKVPYSLNIGNTTLSMSAGNGT